MRRALLFVGDQATAEDVVQDVFARLHGGAGRLREPDKALPYLRTAVVNGCRSVPRARRRARLLRVPHEPPVWSAEAAALDGEDRRAVLAAVARLARRQREVLVLRYYAGLADHEIAAALQVSRGTVSSTASRALEGRTTTTVPMLVGMTGQRPPLLRHAATDHLPQHRRQARLPDPAVR